MGLSKRLAKLVVNVVILLLIMIDVQMIFQILGEVIQGEILRLAVTMLFLAVINIIPVVPIVGIVPFLLERVKENRIRRWTMQPLERTDNGIIGLSVIMFIVFAFTLLFLSVRREYSNPYYWIAGLIPIFTTLISFILKFLIEREKKEDMLRAERERTLIKIKTITDERIRLDSNVPFLENLTVYINEIQQYVEDYKDNMRDFIDHNKDMQKKDREAANRVVANNCRIHLTDFFEICKKQFIDYNITETPEGKKRFADLENFQKKLMSDLDKEIGNVKTP